MVINEKLIDRGIDFVLTHGTSFLWTLVILVVGLKLSKYLTKLAKNFIEKSAIDESVSSFLISFIRIGLKVFVFVMVAMRLGVDKASFVAIIGSAGLAIGLAFQGSLSNIAGGFLILLLKPFQIGDYIKEDSHGNEGNVISIDLFYTRIQTIDNKIIVVPNGVISNTSLTNVTRQEERLLDLRVGIGYDDDLLLAKQIVKEVATKQSLTINEDEIQVFVADLADSCISVGLRVWVPTDSYFAIRCDILEKIKLAFDENHINIPYNQMDVHIIEKKA